MRVHGYVVLLPYKRMTYEALGAIFMILTVFVLPHPWEKTYYHGPK